MNTPYNQLRQILTEKLGEEKNVTRYFPDCEECGHSTSKSFSYIKPFGLQDVLLAIDSKGGTNCNLEQHSGKLKIWGNIEMVECYYDLTKPLSNQSDETLLTIIELLK